MAAFSTLSGVERLLTVALAGTASMAVLGATAALFVDDTRTPWFAPDTPLARAAAACERASSARHACLRALAQARTHLASASGERLPH